MSLRGSRSPIEQGTSLRTANDPTTAEIMEITMRVPESHSASRPEVHSGKNDARMSSSPMVPPHKQTARSADHPCIWKTQVINVEFTACTSGTAIQ
jgi:hypothetical protein